MKVILSIIIILSGLSVQAQTSRGLAVDFGSDKRINDMRRHEAEMDWIYKERYERVLEAYKKDLELNQYSTNPKEEPKEGWYTVLATNGYGFLENRQVFVENGNVTRYKKNENEVFKILEGGRIIKYRTVIKTSANTTVGLFFNLMAKQ